jgi:hypothetical protein
MEEVNEFNYLRWYARIERKPVNRIPENDWNNKTDEKQSFYEYLSKTA